MSTQLLTKLEKFNNFYQKDLGQLKNIEQIFKYKTVSTLLGVLAQLIISILQSSSNKQAWYWHEIETQIKVTVPRNQLQLPNS